MSILGDNVKRIRQEKKMSQDELAQLAGYNSRSTISCIESGKRDCPQKQILAIARALGVSPGDLLNDINTRSQTQQQETSVPLTPDEKQLLSLYNSMNDEGKEKALERLEEMAAFDRYKKEYQSTLADEA